MPDKKVRTTSPGEKKKWQCLATTNENIGGQKPQKKKKGVVGSGEEHKGKW